MKLPKLNPGKKLQATARRVRAGVAERAPERAVADYDEEEPVTRFSSALVVVLLLHVTAFGGIYAFDHLKQHRASSGTTPSVTKTEVAPSTADTAATATLPANKPESTTPAKGRTDARTDSTDRPAVTADRKETQDRSAASAKPSVYTVVKGDNPVTIAHHFGVSYDELLKVNNIEDPKRLQIGQKLKIPGRKLGETAGKLTSQGHASAAE